MLRMKKTAAPKPNPPGSLLAGMVIGSTILTLAAQAIAFGAGAAVREISIKGP